MAFSFTLVFNFGIHNLLSEFSTNVKDQYEEESIVLVPDFKNHNLP